MLVISGSLAICDFDVLQEYAFSPKSLRVPDLTSIFDSSLRRFMNNPGLQRADQGRVEASATSFPRPVSAGCTTTTS
jgi:hypothetical protein